MNFGRKKLNCILTMTFSRKNASDIVCGETFSRKYYKLYFDCLNRKNVSSEAVCAHSPTPSLVHTPHDASFGRKK